MPHFPSPEQIYGMKLPVAFSLIGADVHLADYVASIRSRELADKGIGVRGAGGGGGH